MVKVYVAQIQVDVPSAKAKSMVWRAWAHQKKAFFRLEDLEAYYKPYIEHSFIRDGSLFWMAVLKKDNPFKGYVIRAFEVEIDDAKPDAN